MTSHAHQPPQIARANGIDICYEIFGDADAEPMLLIMGLGAQMIIGTTNSAASSRAAAFA